MLFEVFSVKQTTLEIRQIRIAGKKHELGRIWMGQQHKKKGALDLALTMGLEAGRFGEGGLQGRVGPWGGAATQRWALERRWPMHQGDGRLRPQQARS